jgi:hypothetical protein
MSPRDLIPTICLVVLLALYGCASGQPATGATAAAVQ